MLYYPWQIWTIYNPLHHCTTGENFFWKELKMVQHSNAQWRWQAKKCYEATSDLKDHNGNDSEVNLDVLYVVKSNNIESK